MSAGAGGPGDTGFDDGLEEELVLTELVSRVLDRGAMIAGEVTISVAGIDLVELGLHLYLVSAETAREVGISTSPGRARSPARPAVPPGRSVARTEDPGE